MPSISFSPSANVRYWSTLPWSERLTVIKLWGHRIGLYTAINLLDDPAWLALMFC
jgi:hypothetical protein